MNQIAKLLQIISDLRHPETGCPWDIKQTHTSLVKHLREESAEVIDAILNNDSDNLREELGDLLLQILLHAQIASESGQFSFQDIVAELSAKLVERHPHVFNRNDARFDESSQPQTAEAVKAQWDAIKESKRARQSLLDGIPDSLSALSTALKLGVRAERVNFQWHQVSDLKNQIKDEVFEFLESDCDPEEFGDILFSLVQLARYLNIDPEDSLTLTNLKFVKRFRMMEEKAGDKFADLDLDAKQKLWEEVKEEIRVKKERFGD